MGAVAATIFGWWNVSRAAGFSRENELQKWRRDVLLPALADFIEAADIAYNALAARVYVDWSEIDEGRERRESEGAAALLELSRTDAKLELVATPHVHAAANGLRLALDSADVNSWRIGPTTDVDAEWMKASDAVTLHRRAFVLAARDSLGIPGPDVAFERMAERLGEKMDAHLEREENRKRRKGSQP